MPASRGRLTRRTFLSSTALAVFFGASTARAAIIQGTQPWSPFAESPPETLGPGGWYFFTQNEARAVEAIVERLVPGDELSVSGKEAGCAIFIDRQLAGSYGTSARLYMSPPFRQGTPAQGDQSELTPQSRYRRGLAALDRYCRVNGGGKGFADWPEADRDTLLKGLEDGTVTLPGFDGRQFFEAILQNTMEGFFADPIYGGNRDMVSWKMIGFPGARYDYRDYIERHNETLDLPPVQIGGRPQPARRS